MFKLLTHKRLNGHPAVDADRLAEVALGFLVIDAAGAGVGQHESLDRLGVRTVRHRVGVGVV